MALKVNRDTGVTIGGEFYPFRTRKEIVRTEGREPDPDDPEDEGEPGNAEEIDELLEQGYLIDTEAEDESEPEPAPKKAKKAGKGKGRK